MSIFTDHGLNCPVTHGLATRMRRESFAAACDAKRTQGEPSGISDGVLFFRICQKCNGNHQPEELEIIEMPRKKGAGACDCCGNNSVDLRRGYEQDLCPTCYTIHSHAKNRGHLVLDTISKLHGRAYLEEYLGEAALPQQDNCSELEHALLLSQQELEKAREEVDELRRELEQHKECLTRAESAIEYYERELELSDECLHLTPVLLDIALDVIRGKITGLSANQIERLRGAA